MKKKTVRETAIRVKIKEIREGVSLVLEKQKKIIRQKLFDVLYRMELHGTVLGRLLCARLPAPLMLSPHQLLEITSLV